VLRHCLGSMVPSLPPLAVASGMTDGATLGDVSVAATLGFLEPMSVCVLLHHNRYEPRLPELSPW
jgi:hypothetical protein